MRVDIDFKQEGDRDENDYETTIFIGNLPFVCNEEDLRKHFANISGGGDVASGGQSNDGILNVRVVRDPKTFIGKGIAYI